MHEIFISKIDNFLRGQINPPESLIKLEQKVIHDNSFFKTLFTIISNIKIIKSDPVIKTFATIVTSSTKEEEACLLWIQLISFTRANELYQIISDYLLNLKRKQEILNKNGIKVEAIICYSPIKLHKTDKILSRFSSFVIGIKKNNAFVRTITGIALSVVYDKTKRITENRVLTWNPIIFPVISNNKFCKITKYKLLKIINQIYADNN